MKHISHVNLYNLEEYLILTMEVGYNTGVLNWVYPYHILSCNFTMIVLLSHWIFWESRITIYVSINVLIKHASLSRGSVLFCFVVQLMKKKSNKRVGIKCKSWMGFSVPSFSGHQNEYLSPRHKSLSFSIMYRFKAHFCCLPENIHLAGEGYCNFACSSYGA